MAGPVRPDRPQPPSPSTDAKSETGTTSDLPRVGENPTLDFQKGISQAIQEKDILAILQLIVFAISSVLGLTSLSSTSRSDDTLELGLIMDLHEGTVQPSKENLERLFGHREAELQARAEKLSEGDVAGFLKDVAARREALSVDLPKNCHQERDKRLEQLNTVEKQALDVVAQGVSISQSTPNQALFELHARLEALGLPEMEVVQKELKAIKDEFARRETEAQEALKEAIPQRLRDVQTSLLGLKTSQKSTAQAYKASVNAVTEKQQALGKLQRQLEIKRQDLTRLQKAREAKFDAELKNDSTVRDTPEEILKLQGQLDVVKAKGKTLLAFRGKNKREAEIARLNKEITAKQTAMNQRIEAITKRIEEIFDRDIKKFEREIADLEGGIERATEELNVAEAQSQEALKEANENQRLYDAASEAQARGAQKLMPQLKAYARAVVFRDAAERQENPFNYEEFPPQTKKVFRAGLEELSLSLELDTVLQIGEINT